MKKFMVKQVGSISVFIVFFFLGFHVPKQVLIIRHIAVEGSELILTTWGSLMGAPSLLYVCKLTGFPVGVSTLMFQ